MDRTPPELRDRLAAGGGAPTAAARSRIAAGNGPSGTGSSGPGRRVGGPGSPDHPQGPEPCRARPRGLPRRPPARAARRLGCTKPAHGA